MRFNSYERDDYEYEDNEVKIRNKSSTESYLPPINESPEGAYGTNQDNFDRQAACKLKS